MLAAARLAANLRLGWSWTAARAECDGPEAPAPPHSVTAFTGFPTEAKGPTGGNSSPRSWFPWSTQAERDAALRHSVHLSCPITGVSGLLHCLPLRVAANHGAYRGRPGKNLTAMMIIRTRRFTGM